MAAGREGLVGRGRSEKFWFALIPLVITLLGVSHLVLTEVVVPFDVVFAVVPGVTSSLVIGASVMRGVPEEQFGRLLRWTVGGGAVLIPIPLAVLWSPYVQVIEPQVPVIVALWLGMTGGFVAGVQEVRALNEAVQSAEARIERDIARQERTRHQEVTRLLRHDILNSVMVIDSYAEFMMEDTNEETAADAEAIRRQAQSVASLIRNVRAYLEATHEGPADTYPVSLGPIVEQEVSALEAEFPQVTVETTLEPEVSVLAGDLLDSVFTNLLRNAVIHNPADDPEVAVTVATSGETVTIRVVDNGPGIPPDLVQDLFTADDRHDHGLGLSLVKLLVEQYGGTVEVERTESSGTVMAVTLPRAAR